ncbi:glutathione S-transferase family protein [Maricurvus nonylphenolicus]|uniref:glutathione S-transferase family protein n=1 Tax=Maricurvus nonylphenolicus TaxID=1008307 RepID=UPI0036F1FAC3
MKLYHSRNTRSLRALWMLEEMGVDYELDILPFPPRVKQPEYLQINKLGTVPYFVDGDISMTESTGICQYLGDKYQSALVVSADHPEYGEYINWLHQSDASLTFPQSLVLRYTVMDKNPETRVVAEQYKTWFLSRIQRASDRLKDHEYLVDDRFTIADIAVGYAIFLATKVPVAEGKIIDLLEPHMRAYLDRLMSRPAFIKAEALGA